MKTIIDFFKKIRTHYHDFIIFGAAILGFLLPFILYFFGEGLAESISAYHYEVPNLLFILLTIMALGFMTGSSRYQLSGLLLFGLAAVNLEVSQLFHNIIAGLFFLHTTRIIAVDRKFQLYSVPIFLAMLFLFGGVIDLYGFEIVGIMTISMFTMTYSYLKITTREIRILDTIKEMKRTLTKKPKEKLEN
jgi:hypothetical protein